MTHLFDLAGRTYFVTGASSGIGRAIAVHLLRIGANVIGVARGTEALRKLEEETREAPGEIVTLRADVTDPESVEAALHKGMDRLGPLHGAVLAASHNIREPILDMSCEHWRSVLGTNLSGYFYSARAVGRALQERGGSIVAIGSLSTRIAYANSGSYAASKAGMTQLSRVMALEWAPHLVRVNVLLPGRIRTPLIESVLNDPAQMEWMMMRIPMKRLGEVADLLGPVQFLLSDASNYMTGALLIVDGGWEMSA